MYHHMYLTPETAIGYLNVSIEFVERPFLKLKDYFIPLSPAQLDKRVARYVDTYLLGGTASMPIIWDAFKNGADVNQQVPKEDGSGGKEPLIVKAAAAGNFLLVQALQAAGADINAADSNGVTALMAGAKKGSVEITSFLVEVGAKLDALEKKTGTDALYIAETAGKPKVASLLKAALAFKAANDGKTAEVKTPAAAPAPSAASNTP